jgi:plastocyanin
MARIALPRAVSISGFQFRPAELSVAVGDTVTWVNEDPLRHTTTADSAAWASSELEQGHRFVLVAKRSGRFPYHCAAHPAMRAALVVTQ